MNHDYYSAKCIDIIYYDSVVRPLDKYCDKLMGKIHFCRAAQEYSQQLVGMVREKPVRGVAGEGINLNLISLQFTPTRQVLQSSL